VSSVASEVERVDVLLVPVEGVPNHAVLNVPDLFGKKNVKTEANIRQILRGDIITRMYHNRCHCSNDYRHVKK
jgi:hypothetical protein